MATTDDVTLVRNAIHNPAEPRHFMRIVPSATRRQALVDEVTIADSADALVLKEVGRDIYDPVIYFPPEDVDSGALTPTDVVTRCPLKGEAVAFDITGDPVIERGAWSYQKTLDFDRRLAQLECCVAFDGAAVTLEISG